MYVCMYEDELKTLEFKIEFLKLLRPDRNLQIFAVFSSEYFIFPWPI